MSLSLNELMASNEICGTKVCCADTDLNDIDGLVQERYNSSALAMELHLSCTNPLVWCDKLHGNPVNDNFKHISLK